MKPSQFSAHGLPGALTRASPLHLTSHALSRALERLGCNTVAEAEELLRSPAIARAAAFGAPGVRMAVRLPSGHRIILEGWTVITVLPPENFKRQVRRRGLGRYGKTHGMDGRT